MWSAEYRVEKGTVSLAIYRRLPNADRQFVVIAGAAHSLGLSSDRHRLWHVVRAFLETPVGEGGRDGGRR